MKIVSFNMRGWGGECEEEAVGFVHSERRV
jgi:hypothetical protein